MPARRSAPKLICGDSFRLIRDIPSSSVDLVMTDVPYPDQEVHDGITPPIPSDQWIDYFAPMAEQIKRVLKPTGSFVTTINSKGQDRGFYFEWVTWMRRQQGWVYPMTWYWVKRDIIPGSPVRMRIPRDGVDFIAWFTPTYSRYKIDLSRVDWKTVNPATACPTNLIKAGVRDDKSYWKAREKTGLEHTGKYPGLIPRIFIQIMTDPGDVVLDPFNGSGTTLLEAAKLKRKAVGFELNENNIRLTKAIFEEERIRLVEMI